MEKTRKLNEKIGQIVSQISHLRELQQEITGNAASDDSTNPRPRHDSPVRGLTKTVEEIKTEISDLQEEITKHKKSIAMYDASNRKIIQDVSEIILRGDDAIIEIFGEIIKQRSSMLRMGTGTGTGMGTGMGRGGKMRTLRRGVKKNTRRSRRRYSKLKKNTQRCRSRKSKTRRR